MKSSKNNKKSKLGAKIAAVCMALMMAIAMAIPSFAGPIGAATAGIAADAALKTVGAGLAIHGATVATKTVADYTSALTNGAINIATGYAEKPDLTNVTYYVPDAVGEQLQNAGYVKYPRDYSNTTQQTQTK